MFDKVIIKHSFIPVFNNKLHFTLGTPDIKKLYSTISDILKLFFFCFYQT